MLIKPRLKRASRFYRDKVESGAELAMNTSNRFQNP